MANIADSAARIRDLRTSIDNIDAAIVHMLAERFRCTRAVG
jgi:chorismate mutase